MKLSDTNGYYLVHANVAHARAPLDSPLMADFVAQPTLPDEGAVYTAPLLLNVSIWDSVESLDAFTHQGKHAVALERRGEWFEQQGTGSNYVLYWIPKGHIVTAEHVRRLMDEEGI